MSSPPRHGAASARSWPGFKAGAPRLIRWSQAFSTVRVTPARSSTALASSSRTGVRSPRSAPSSSTTSRPSNKRHVISIGAGRSQFRGVIDEASGLFHGRVHNDFIGCTTSFDGWHGSDMGYLRKWTPHVRIQKRKSSTGPQRFFVKSLHNSVLYFSCLHDANLTTFPSTMKYSWKSANALLHSSSKTRSM